MNIPRPEHPNPQFMRKNWQNLNGEWEFDFDFSNSAIDKELFKSEHLSKKITVPFCPESELSGINYKDFIPAVCYRRDIVISKENLNGRVLLHFGAVDYKTTVYINGQEVGEHIGGYTPFTFDITEFVNEGVNSLFVYAEDDLRSGKQCVGKQSQKSYSYGCSYTRTTGIWQTVWLEFVPKNYITDVKYYSCSEEPSVTVVGQAVGKGEIFLKIFLDGEEVGNGKTYADNNFSLTVKLSKKRLWEVGKGGLYDMEFTFCEDKVKSYFGLRDIKLDNYKFLINGKSVFQRLVLDQGFYKDGIYTAPTDEALKKDIELSLAAGFNGARLHEKVFEKRFLYHADKMGYLVWDEYPNWGLSDYINNISTGDLYAGWMEVIERDFNSPSVIGWCPFNETWGYSEKAQGTKTLQTVYKITKAMDTTRPCIDASGGYHILTDIYDVHDYSGPETIKERYKEFGEKGEFDLSGYERMEPPFFKDCYTHKKGQPVFVSEYGGIKWDKDALNDHKASWGYGTMPESEEEFIERYKGVTDPLLDNKYMFGFCYTQLYDVEQEKNGLYTYEREPKFDMEIFKKINSRKAAIED